MKKLQTKFCFDFLVEAEELSNKLEFLIEETVVIEGFSTFIGIFEKTVFGEHKFVAKIERIYPSGEKYSEPEHIWSNLVEARIDFKDWKYLAKKTDW